MNTKNNLTGRKFNKLIVIKFSGMKNHHSMWTCSCECGKIIDVLGTNLTSGKSGSCGCNRNKQRIDYEKYVGKRFGKLVVIERKDINSKYKCVCDCGKIIYVSPGNLSYTKSCGCSRRANGIDRVFYRYKEEAKKRGYIFSLEKTYFESLIAGKCAYCKKPPSNTLRGYVYNGIDRIDNSKGYIKGNVVSCCKTCNYAKKGMSMFEFTEWVISVYKNLTSNS